MTQNKEEQKTEMQIGIYDKSSPTFDWLILQWFAVMKDNGELKYTFIGKDMSPGEFLRYFSESATLLYSLDKSGLICRASWIESFMGGAFFGLYIRSDVRKSKLSYKFVVASYELAFKNYPILLGVVSATREDINKVTAEHLKLGYAYPAFFPFIFGGQGAYVFYITEELWNGTGRRRALKCLVEKHHLQANLVNGSVNGSLNSQNQH